MPEVGRYESAKNNRPEDSKALAVFCTNYKRLMIQNVCVCVHARARACVCVRMRVYVYGAMRFMCVKVYERIIRKYRLRQYDQDNSLRKQTLFTTMLILHV